MVDIVNYIGEKKSKVEMKSSILAWLVFLLGGVIMAILIILLFIIGIVFLIIMIPIVIIVDVVNLLMFIFGWMFK